MRYLVILLALLAIIVLAYLFLRKPDRSAVAVEATYDGPIEQYTGGKTLLVAVYAPWASVWPATAEALSEVDPAEYDITLIDADQDKQAVADLAVEIVPTVIVYRENREIARLPNMMSLDQLP